MTTSRGNLPIRAKSLRFVEIDGRTFIEIVLEDERRHQVPLDFYPTLVSATPQQRGNWEWIGRGFGVSWPDVDVDLSVEGMVAGLREYTRAATTKAKGPAIPASPPKSRKNTVIGRPNSTGSSKNARSKITATYEIRNPASSARSAVRKVDAQTGEFRGIPSKHGRSATGSRKK